MSFFNSFKIADEKTCKANWSGAPKGELFFCDFCGHKFMVNDEYMAVYTNDISGASGNPLTCRPCFDKHGGIQGLRQQWVDLHFEYETKFKTKFKWWSKRDKHQKGD